MKREEVPPINLLKLAPGSYIVYERELENKENENSCLLSYFQAGKAPCTLEEEMVASVLFEILNEPCFTKLRSEEQLGYIVFSS